MSEHIYDEAGIKRTVQCDQNKENTADIFLSAESLRVYENPWVEGTAPIPTPAEAQRPGMNKTYNIRDDTVYDFKSIVVFLF